MVTRERESFLLSMRVPVLAASRCRKTVPLPVRGERPTGPTTVLKRVQLRFRCSVRLETGDWRLETGYEAQ